LISNEILWVAMLLLNFMAVIILYRFAGKTGLYVWIPISVIIANIQVLKTVELFGMEATLGNIVYATSFLVTDILSEKYGRKEAGKAVFLGFFSLITMTVFMNLALYFQPADSDFAHESLRTLFSFLPRLAFASLLAYSLAQTFDIWAFETIRKFLPSDKFLWVRNNGSTMISQLIDSVIFTMTAFFGVFETPVLTEIIISTYFLKWIVAAADTPFVYLAKRIHPRDELPGGDVSS